MGFILSVSGSTLRKDIKPTLVVLVYRVLVEYDSKTNLNVLQGYP